MGLKMLFTPQVSAKIDYKDVITCLPELDSDEDDDDDDADGSDSDVNSCARLDRVLLVLGHKEAMGCARHVG
jgi:hypothetical protein